MLLVADKYGLDIKSTLSILPLGGHKPSLISARRTTTKWCALISNEILAAKLQSSAADAGYSLNNDEMATAAELISSGHLAQEAMATLAARIKTSWSRNSYWCRAAGEVRCAAALAATGHLTRRVECHAAAGPGAAQHRGHAQPGQGGLGQTLERGLFCDLIVKMLPIA